MTVYGPRLYFGPLPTPHPDIPDSDCSHATVQETPTPDPDEEDD